MARGGARANSGPAPDPNALRRDRPDDAATWITLPTERTGPAPEWPLAVAALPNELVHWEKVWKTPQATEWERLGVFTEVALYVRTLAEAEMPGAAANLRTLVKQLQENLGVSITGLLTRRWRIAGAGSAPTAAATDAPTRPSRPASSRPSAKERFRVVPPIDA